mgnify:CR=1 FL=1|tara:strand:+ start:19786 stop:20385 length:600 start_codon:yes stop_codon:yes gene_type:complete
MKIVSNSQQCHRGWTLTELLFVMLIMIGLAGLVAGSIGPVKNRVTRYQASAQLGMLATGLADYNSEYGGFPICEDLADSGNILYKTLFGDFDESGKPDWLATDKNDGAVKTFVTKLQPHPNVLDSDPETLPQGTTYVLDLDNGLTVVDPWNMPLGYINFRKGQNSQVPNGGGAKNPTYDLWSFGNDQSFKNEATWITNW